ncbi:MAG: FkbM family methyltransferase [Hyphomicrobium sp.]
MANDGPDDQQRSWGTFAPGMAANAILYLSRNTPLGRGFSRKAMASRFKALHSGPVDVPLWGTNVRLFPDNNVVERKALLRPDHFDAVERMLLRRAMSGVLPVFVDVGGNAGLYSLDAALHANDAATILMIEPDTDLIARFAFNLDEARRGGRVNSSLKVSTIAVAISDSVGEGVLSSAGDEGSRNLVTGAAIVGRPVPLRTLHAVVSDAQIDHIDLMKIDVEGHEDKVLPPFFKSAPLQLWPKKIIIEHLQRSRWSPDCIADAEARGYRSTVITRNNTLLERG